MQKIYVSLKRDTHYHKNINSGLIAILGIIAFVFISLFIRNCFNSAREELIERLGKEREVAQTNEKLKVELAGITRGRYIELKAKERLGLKMPKEEEVLVLRNE